MLRPFWVDLHMHTALSPCGELEMGAPDIIGRAKEVGLDVIGIADGAIHAIDGSVHTITAMNGQIDLTTLLTDTSPMAQPR